MRAAKHAILLIFPAAAVAAAAAVEGVVQKFHWEGGGRVQGLVQKATKQTLKIPSRLPPPTHVGKHDNLHDFTLLLLLPQPHFSCPDKSSKKKIPLRQKEITPICSQRS